MAELHCALCGRAMAAATVFIGQLPVGPTCARRAGLVKLARKKSGALRLGRAIAPATRREDTQTLDLFREVDHG